MKMRKEGTLLMCMVEIGLILLQDAVTDASIPRRPTDRSMSKSTLAKRFILPFKAYFTAITTQSTSTARVTQSRTLSPTTQGASFTALTTQSTSTARVTQSIASTLPPTTQGVWSSWGHWQCKIMNNGACQMTRYRTCITGNLTDCPGKNYNIGTCDKAVCPGTRAPISVTPPVQTDSCRDLSPQSCKLLGLQNNNFCFGQSVKNYFCREFCGTCVNTAQPTSASTVNSVGWSNWGVWHCMSVKNGSCLMIRYRTCSSGNPTDCPGLNYNITPCDKTICPVFFTVLGTQSTSTVSTSPPTTPGGDCFDAQGCSNPDVANMVCRDRDLAIHICPKRCNLCDQCRDATGLNCSSPFIQKAFCPDRTLSVQYCRKTCNKCNEKPIPITRNKCGDPVANDYICDFLDQEICLCKDNALRPFLCRNYCAGKCGPKAPSPASCALIG